MFETLKKRKLFNCQFGMLCDLEDGRRFRIEEAREFSLPDGRPLILAVGIHRKSKKPYRLKLVHSLPGKPHGIEEMPKEWEVMESGARYVISWPEEVFIESSIRSIEISPNDPLGMYELEVFIDGKSTSRIEYAVHA
jgi:hypothetical protein